MKIINIDLDKCNKCQNCIKVCPSKLYSKEKKHDGNILFYNPYSTCVRCGHCIAICPTEAIIYEDADLPFYFEGTKNLGEIVLYSDLLKILRMRRSMRVFSQEAVSKEKIEQVLEAMRYAPTASNSQGWRYIVITDKQEINYLSHETMNFFKQIRKLLPLRYLIAPFLSGRTRERALNPKSKTQLDKTLTRIKDGEDLIFFNAPCVIILYARNYAGGMAYNDAGIAFTYGMLAAQALGLGTCWVGFAQTQLQRDKKLQKHFGIPKGYKVMGVMTIGIPAIKYLRGPPRNPLKVKWME